MLHVVWLFLLLGLFTEASATECKRWNTTMLHPYCKQVLREKGWVFCRETSHFSCKVDGSQTETVHLDFVAPQCLTLSDSRRYLIEETQRFFCMMNRRQPKSMGCFTSTHLEYSVGFKNGRGEYCSPPQIAHVYLVDDTVVFEHYNQASKQLVVHHEEPYQQSLKIVQEECCR